MWKTSLLISRTKAVDNSLILFYRNRTQVILNYIDFCGIIKGCASQTGWPGSFGGRMAKRFLKLADLSPVMVGAIFQVVNHNRVTYYRGWEDYCGPNNPYGVIVSPVDPEKLTQLDGWEITGKHGSVCLVNHGRSSQTIRYEIPFWRLDGTNW